MTLNQDIIIAGGGMVGMTAAIAFARLGLSVSVIEKSAMPAQLAPSFDGRVSAVALGSARFLQHIGVWDMMACHAEPILDIRVSDGDSHAFVHYDHRDVGSDPFGYIIENRYIRHALQQAAAELPSLSILDHAYIAAYETAKIQLHDGRVLTASLVLAAEGRDSPLRGMVGIGAYTKEYNQTAIVATIAHEKPHHGLAQERFLPAGPFAVLPMPSNHSSLVWVEPRDRAPLYMNLSTAECEQEITERVGGYLGKIRLAGERFAYPLSLIHAHCYIDSRFALMGDAAHGMHPIAGQGVNVGFRDVAVLEDLIRKQQLVGGDIGADTLLAHYQRWRRFDNVSMLGVTDGINQLFCSQWLPVKAARGLGLRVVNHLPPLKRFFMRHAMGLVGDVPEGMRVTRQDHHPTRQHG